MKDYFQLRKNLKKDFSKLPLIKMAVLGDTATQFLCNTIRAVGCEKELNIEIWEADYNQIETQILVPNSELYKFNTDIIVLFFATHKLLDSYNKLNPSQYNTLALTEKERIIKLLDIIKENTSAQVIIYNYYNINDAVFGSYGLKTESSFIFQLHKLNFELMTLATQRNEMLLCDISTLKNCIGEKTFFQPSLYLNSDMVLNLDVLPLVASRTVDIVCSLNARIKKCVIIDLDNTIWGGLIGEDGIENIQIGTLGIGKAFTEFQHWLKKLKNRGIILAVCSKNDEITAKEPFEKHPDMVLKLDDFAVFIANWNNKAENIKEIQKLLNIGFDSMVFIDDSAFERGMVSQLIPEVSVPEMPEDPACFLQYLYELNLFETSSFSEEDKKRTQQYKLEAQRKLSKQSFSDEDTYLKSLDMKALVEPLNTFNIPRAAQLSQRSNQFNLRTVRYTEDVLEKIAISEEFFTFAFSLYDKFGENGLISLIILHKENEKTLFVNTWLMSCRVLKRGMEQFSLNTIASFGLNNGFSFIKGEYIPTLKNSMVKEHYKNLGFTKNNGSWILNLHDFKEKETYICKKISNQEY